jgi:hypothetical protein
VQRRHRRPRQAPQVAVARSGVHGGEAGGAGLVEEGHHVLGRVGEAVVLVRGDPVERVPVRDAGRVGGVLGRWVRQQAGGACVLQGPELHEPAVETAASGARSKVMVMIQLHHRRRRQLGVVVVVIVAGRRRPAHVLEDVVERVVAGGVQHLRLHVVAHGHRRRRAVARRAALHRHRGCCHLGSGRRGGGGAAAALAVVQDEVLFLKHPADDPASLLRRLLVSGGRATTHLYYAGPDVSSVNIACV